MNEPGRTPLSVADRLLEWAAASLPAPPGVAVRDHNDALLCAAYGRAYRCFASIRDLARPPRCEADDAWILARALLSIVLRSIWLVQPDNVNERETRRRQAMLKYFMERKKLAREEQAAGVDVGDLTPDRYQRAIDELLAQGVALPPNDHDLAVDLELAAFYTRVYRPGSDTSHYSIGAALDGFLELTSMPGVGPVALEKPDEERATEALAVAAITYGAFLHLSEPVIGHGLGRKARDLLADMAV